MVELLVVRHGESLWNREGRWQGRADPVLSDEGRRQAEIAGHRLVELGGFSDVVASPLLRAVETAEVIAGLLGLRVSRYFPGLMEHDVGEWSGLTNSEIDQRFPGVRERGGRPSGWEEEAVLLGRVLAALDEIASASSGRVVVVTHGGVIRALEHHLAGGTPPPVVRNLGARWIEHGADGLVLGPVVDLLVGSTSAS